MRFLFLVIQLFAYAANASDAAELAKFENGQVADADDINANFELLKELIDESTDTSCSISVSGVITSISCPDGSSASLSSSNQNSVCAETDFEGTWIFSGPDFDNGYVADLDFYTLYTNKSLEYASYECSVNGCVLLEEISGNWGEFDRDVCAIQVAADVVSPSSARGFVFLSASKSAVTGFVCDAVLGCKAGTLQKGAASAQGKAILQSLIKSTQVPKSDGVKR